MATEAKVEQSSACKKEMPEDFAAWVANYRPRLYRTALRQLGNPDDAEDALQDALLSAYRHLDQFQGRAQLSTWLTRIVINAARELQRRRHARPAVSLEALPAAGELFPDRQASPESRCSLGERRERLRRLMARLSPPLRSAVQLYEIEGLSCRQAAEQLGIKPATLKCRLFRGRERLAHLARAV